MRDAMPSSGPWKNESAIVNLDSSKGDGSHWVSFKKRGDIVTYFDSYGNLRPPRELVNYFKSCKIIYNTHLYQRKSYNCGHLCLDFLNKSKVN